MPTAFVQTMLQTHMGSCCAIDAILALETAAELQTHMGSYCTFGAIETDITLEALQTHMGSCCTLTTGISRFTMPTGFKRTSVPAVPASIALHVEP